MERHKGAPTALACLRFGCPEPPFIGKTYCVATFYLFAHMDILSSGFLFFDILSSSLLFSSLLCLFPPMLFICPVFWKFEFYTFFGYLSCLILSYLIISVLSYLSNLIQSDLCNLIQSYLSNMIQSYLSNPFQFNLSNLIYVIFSI